MPLCFTRTTFVTAPASVIVVCLSIPVFRFLLLRVRLLHPAGSSGSLWKMSAVAQPGGLAASPAQSETKQEALVFKVMRLNRPSFFSPPSSTANVRIPPRCCTPPPLPCPFQSRAHEKDDEVTFPPEMNGFAPALEIMHMLPYPLAFYPVWPHPQPANPVPSSFPPSCAAAEQPESGVAHLCQCPPPLWSDVAFCCLFLLHRCWRELTIVFWF